jgi:hypothetical protein
VTTADSNEIYAGSEGAVSPDNQTLYWAEDSDPSSLYSLSIATPTSPVEEQENFGQPYQACDEVWVSGDGSLLYTGCGNVFHASDLSYAGMLPSVTAVLSLDDHSPDGTIAALVVSPGSIAYQVAQLITADSVQLYSATYFQPTGTLALPALATPGGAASSRALFVFHDAAGTGTVVLLHATDPASSTDVYGVALL